MTMSGQEIDDSIEETRFLAKPKKYNLTFRIDYSVSQLFVNHKYKYEGEYQNSLGSDVEWISLDSTIINFDKLIRDINLKFDLMISTVEPLNIGLTYHLLSYSTEFINSSGLFPVRYNVFLGLGAIVDYRWKIKPVKGLIINPSATVGYYISDEYFSGKGREGYYNLKLAALYNLWDKLDIRLYTDYSSWKYSENSTSVVFADRNREISNFVKHMNFGAGLAYRFHLIPD